MIYISLHAYYGEVSVKKVDLYFYGLKVKYTSPFLTYEKKRAYFPSCDRIVMEILVGKKPNLT